MRTLGAKREEVRRGRRKQNNESLVLLTKFYYGNQIKDNEIGGTCITNRDDKNAYNILVKKSENKSEHLGDLDV
jgi:hypothetical protein